MNCFQIIKSILDEAYEQIPGNEVIKDNLINEKLEYLRVKYNQLLNGITIEYSDPVTRFAYIYAYVTSHANLVSTIINNNNELSNLFDNQRVSIACIGGGPGSDFLGVLKYLMTNNKYPDVKFQLCDKEKTWAESWSNVDDKVEPQFRVSTCYLPLDVTKPEDWKPYTNYFQSDLFTMIYFISEVFAFRDSAEEYFETLFSKAKSGSLFLFIDNNNLNFYRWFDDLAETNNVKIIARKEGYEGLPYHEEKSDLGRYYEKFSSPKIKANIAYRIGKKE